MNKGDGWYGVDLDGTLAIWTDGQSILTIGPPIYPMVRRVQQWIADRVEVRIFTARVGVCGSTSDQGTDDEAFANVQRGLISEWCNTHIGRRLAVTATKDFRMVELWDDRAVQVVPNTGMPLADLISEEALAEAVARGGKP